MAFAAVSAPIWRQVLKRRIKRGKEDAASVQQKLGYASRPRPDGALIWFHALSVGESLALMTLLKRLGEDLPAAHFLLTTGTKTSVEALENTGLPPRVIHQYMPADARGPAQRFLNHWQPDVVVFAETDIWPYLISRVARRGTPLLLINAHITDHSFPRRMKARSIYKHILPLFRHIYTQDPLSSQRFQALGANAAQIDLLGPLKSGADPLSDLPEVRKEISAQIAGRPVWMAASTNIREEDQLIVAHKAACEKIPDLLLIIAPRHIKDANQTEALCRAEFDHIARRSRAESIAPNTQIYIADTFGEMGAWCRVAPVAFIGHSMGVDKPHLTGKNPYEALALGAFVLHGAHYRNFHAIYTRLLAAGATKTVADSGGLASEIVLAFQNSAYTRPYLEAAKQCLADDQNALEITRQTISGIMPDN